MQGTGSRRGLKDMLPAQRKLLDESLLASARRLGPLAPSSRLVEGAREWSSDIAKAIGVWEKLVPSEEARTLYLAKLTKDAGLFFGLRLKHPFSRGPMGPKSKDDVRTRGPVMVPAYPGGPLVPLGVPIEIESEPPTKMEQLALRRGYLAVGVSLILALVGWLLIVLFVWWYRIQYVFIDSQGQVVPFPTSEWAPVPWFVPWTFFVLLLASAVVWGNWADARKKVEGRPRWLLHIPSDDWTTSVGFTIFSDSLGVFVREGAESKWIPLTEDERLQTHRASGASKG